MQHLLLCFLALLCVVSAATTTPTPSLASILMKGMFGVPIDAAGVGGGVECVGCTIVIALLEQWSDIHNKTVDESMETLCSYLPDDFGAYCKTLIVEYGARVIEFLEDEASPDEVCHGIDLCSMPQCSLFPKPPRSAENEQKMIKKIATIRKASRNMQSKVKDNPIDWIIKYITQVINTHEPLVDLDGDHFSTLEYLRGDNWRGKDCNDLDDTIYAGRKSSTHGTDTDHDCNGIYGTDESGTPYEDLWCKDTPRYGVAILGDSAGAHFHVPPSYLTSSLINEDTYKDILNIAFSEFDWPQMSAATGYEHTPWVGAPKGNVSSTYLKMLERNRCMFKDFQNIAVNGARVGAMADNIIHSFARNASFDYPVMLSYALIGNDVCNPHYGLSHMTTPDEFYTSVVKSLKILDDGVLPKGSHVSFMGLANGSVLFELLANKIHPLGSYRKDVTYSHYYDYFNCLEISPCFGWMNSNATWRELTTQRAIELSAVYSKIMANNTFKNFDMTYFDNPLQAIFAEYKEQGGDLIDLIEPVDGFHPSQVANYLTAEYQWKLAVQKYPYLMNPINPHNDDIIKKFGNQGGYK
mmetsp:Transcript_19662/g.21878  ORF Transcript_19662/g.21878 Transcript_19662/m.21878 type:complete len:581 (+) Transcript_19662:15-1757(+)